MKFALETWMDEVESEAMDKGRKQKALEIAKNLKANGVDVDTIAKSTGLTVDDVLRL
jgi:predicted transposase/invertase (TIGR01784 family)